MRLAVQNYMLDNCIVPSLSVEYDVTGGLEPSETLCKTRITDTR